MSVDVVIFRVTHYRTCYRMLPWSRAVTSLMSLGEEHKEHLGDRAGIVSSAFPSGNIIHCYFSVGCYGQEFCKLMCDRLKLSTWKVQLGVLQAMNAYFQG